MLNEGDWSVALGLSLLKARQEKGYTMAEMAVFAGCTERQYYRWQGGQVAVPAYALARIADALEVPVAALLP